MPPVEQASETMHSDDELSIDHAAHHVTVRGNPVSVTPLEYRVLSALVANRGQVLSQERLLDMVWGADAVETGQDSVRLCVSHVRKKVEENPRKPRLIETGRGFGDRYIGRWRQARTPASYGCKRGQNSRESASHELDRDRR